MQLMLSLLALGYVASAVAFSDLPVNPGGIGGLFRGPNSETIIKGPDGSVITAAAEGGAVLAESVPVVAAPVAVATPAVAVAAPVAIAAPVIEPVIEAVPVPAPVVESKQSSDLIGPSGRIVTKGSQAIIAGPASTTVTGQAVVAETVVRGPPIIGTPIAAPIATITAAPIGAITSASLSPIAADISPISVTASPIFASPLPLLRADLEANRLLPVGLVSPPPPAVATASAAPGSSTASATAPSGGSATATATLKGASASVQDANGAITTVTSSPLLATGPVIANGIQGLTVAGNRELIRPLQPVVTSSRRLELPELVALPVSSTLAPPVLTNGIQVQGNYGGLGITDRIALTQDQVAVDNRQLNLNRAYIPANNIIPQEVTVTPRPDIGRGRSGPDTLYNTPGLGSVATSTNIQREEGDISLSVTPGSLQLNGLSQEQVVALQNRQILLNQQLQVGQQVGGPGPNQLVGLRPNDEGARLGLANIPQQDLLSPELGRSSLDTSQLQFTNIPLSAVNNIPVGLGNGGDVRGGNDGQGGRYERKTKA